jgi:general secretion pathway protein I
MTRQRGFTLLEVLVAFAILGISLGVLLQTFATGLRNTALAEEYTLATLHAESVLAAIGIEEPLQEGSLQGEIDDKFSWRASVSVYQEEESESSNEFDQRLSVTPYYVVAEVFWETGNGQIRSVVLETLRLALNEE